MVGEQRSMVPPLHWRQWLALVRVPCAWLERAQRGTQNELVDGR